MEAWVAIAAIGAMALFVIIGDRLLDWYLAKPKVPLSWDETQKWEAIRAALEPEIQKESGGLDYLEYYDFRRAREDGEA